MRGVLIGTQPLMLGRAGAYFEVTLDEVRPGESPDGLTLGVTATAPDALPLNNSPATVEHIPETWSLGYDGQMWDCKSGTLTQVDWDPRSLREGDSVGLLVTASEGELIIFRNGTAVCAGPRGIPVASRELYPVVDLLGAARAVRWMPEALPP
ncbi:NHR domain-containing protein [Durusdinium trenchii]